VQVDDLEQYVLDVKAQHPGTPLFLAGQSLGGLISTYTVLRNQSQYAGLLLWSAAIDVKRNLALKILAPLSGVTTYCIRGDKLHLYNAINCASILQ
jgi:alpha-beta hydrolase superfamily lysophospholipase